MRSLPSIFRTTKYKSKVIYPQIPYRISLVLSKTKISRIGYKEFRKSIRPNHAKAQQRLEEKMEARCWSRPVGQCVRHEFSDEEYLSSSVSFSRNFKDYSYEAISAYYTRKIRKEYLHIFLFLDRNVVPSILGLFPYKTIPYRYQTSTS